MIKEILKKLGIAQLNEMQETVIRQFSAGNNNGRNDNSDLLVLSPTGTGKTLAYLLPLLQTIDKDDVQLQAVVITPSRELAMQSNDVLARIGCGYRGMACYGGRSTMEEHRKLRDVNPHVVFATPGRLLDHLEKGNIEFSMVDHIIIDEFDKCLEMGFSREMKSVFGFLNEDCRKILLSATDIVESPSFMNLSRFNRINFITQNQQVNERIQTYIVKSPEKDKLPVLSQLLAERGSEQSIVFLNYRDSVERTADYLSEKGFYIKTYHGGMDQRQREQALHQFSNGSVNILVCTDLASRGLDIPSISNIIHYHMPLGEEEYIHRVGRTARWDAKGNTFFILNDDDKMPEFIDVTHEEYIFSGTSVKSAMPLMITLYIGKGKKDKISKGDIVGYLCKNGGLHSSQIGRIDVYDRYCYVAIQRKTVKKVLQQVAGVKIKGLKTVVEVIR